MAKKWYAPEVRLPQQGTPSNITNQVKSGVVDDYHDSPHPPAQSSAGSKGYSTPLIQKLIHGDCLDKLKLLADNTVDLLCTDAPYGLLIGGEKWDKLPSIKIWKECIRVLKPGAFAYIMSSARQDLLSKMISDISDAGFATDLPSIYWAYRRDACPSGYNISKKIDKDAGVLPVEKIKNKPGRKRKSVKPTGTVNQYYSDPKTELAKQFVGVHSGFNPIPAVEVIIVAMKPMDQQTFLKQVISNGKGNSRFGNCRIPQDGFEHGRFPSNLIVSDHALGKYSMPYDLDRWAYERMLSKVPEKAKQTFPFLTVQKVGQKEKNAELTDIKNTHLTVKPLELFEYLIEMGSQPGDLVADPFCGSGTTCVAAKMLGRGFIGIELVEEHYKIAKERAESTYCNIQNLSAKQNSLVSSINNKTSSLLPQQRDGQQKVRKNKSTSKSSFNQIHFSSKTVEWATPQEVFDELDREFGFTLDPCATHENAKCKHHYTLEEDGLSQDWGQEKVFMNPPYGRAISKWMKKAYEASLMGATVVCLPPARTDTKWWHEYAMKGEIYLIKGRLKFGDAKNSAPFPSAVVIFRPTHQTKDTRSMKMNVIDKDLGRILSAKDLSEILGADEKTIRKYYQRLGGIRIGRHYKFFEKEVINAIQTRNELCWTSKEEHTSDRESIQEERGREELGSRNANAVRRGLAQKDKHGLLN